MSKQKDNRTAEARAVSLHPVGMPIDPACGTGNFLADACGIYFTPKHFLDALDHHRPEDLEKLWESVKPIIGNPPFTCDVKSTRHTDQAHAPRKEKL